MIYNFLLYFNIITSKVSCIPLHDQRIIRFRNNVKPRVKALFLNKKNYHISTRKIIVALIFSYFMSYIQFFLYAEKETKIKKLK